jgi:hypothetical protein
VNYSCSALHVDGEQLMLGYDKFYSVRKEKIIQKTPNKKQHNNNNPKNKNQTNKRFLNYVQYMYFVLSHIEKVMYHKFGTSLKICSFLTF